MYHQDRPLVLRDSLIAVHFWICRIHRLPCPVRMAGPGDWKNTCIVSNFPSAIPTKKHLI